MHCKHQVMASALICTVVSLLLAVFVVRLRVQPEHPSTTAEIEADGGKWVRAKDGRLIEYFTCGTPEGHWVYYQHGYGNTGKFLFSMPEMCEAANALGLRIFSPSQPGFGLSSTYPLDKVRSLVEWPADVQLILEQEGIHELYISGTSAGCVHAFVVAHAFADRVLGVGVNTPTTPLSVEKDENSQMAAATLIVRTVFEYPYAGDLLGWLMSKMSARDRMNAAPDCKAAMDKMERLGVETPRWSAILKSFSDDQNRGMVKGYRGWVDNMAILNQDMPFNVEELARLTSGGRKFIITTSPDDTTNPPSMQQWWMDQVPGSELMHVPAGWGHLHAVTEGMCLELFTKMIKPEV